MITIQNLNFHYGKRKALSELSLLIQEGEIFGLLGPNGSGKTTLFRMLSTAVSPQEGSVQIHDFDLATEASKIRKKIGVTFQSPSLDAKLSVSENLLHHGHLYGMSGSKLKHQMKEALESLGVADRARDRVEKLSGGLKRRVELAKTLLHQPEILILDEPSTGLDPGARIEFWEYLKQLKQEKKMTILVTTHLMEEAECCDRIGILNRGRLVSLGTPDALKKEVGGDVLVICAGEADALAEKIQSKYHLSVIKVNGELHIEHSESSRLVAKIAEAFPGEIESVTFRKPNLEDVFVHQTGMKFSEADQEAPK